ncbi:MAG: hypothetical protein ACJ77G_02125 [Solirubrobacteraceae bacterium]
MAVAEHGEDLAEIKPQLAAACACASALEERLDRLLAAYEQPPPTTKVMLANAYSRARSARRGRLKRF